MSRLWSKLISIGQTRNAFVVNAVQAHVHKILDIGSSFGWALNGLTGKADELWGIDMDTHALEQARANYPHIHFVHQTAATLPFESESFDVVILSEVIEHVGDENKRLVIDEAHRVLKPGGMFVFTAPHAGVFAWADPLDFKRRFTPLYRIYLRITGWKPLTPIEVGHKHLSMREVSSLFGGRFEFETVRYCGLLTSWMGWVLAFATRLPVRLVTPKMEKRLGELQAWESGIKYWPWLAESIRLVARKKPASIAAGAPVHAESSKDHSAASAVTDAELAIS